MDYIYVKDYEWEEYEVKSNHSNKIRRFWKKILGNMPKKLYDECCNTCTRLVHQNQKDFNVKGALPFQFYAEKCSKELQEYLFSYVVFVEIETKEILEWKKQIHLGLQHKLNTTYIN